MPRLDKKIGLIGAGNMGEAFVGALIRSDISDLSKIYISDISNERRNIMNKTFISLSSLSMDLERVAMGYQRGSVKMAERFLEEALMRRNEINKETVKPYIKKY